MFVLKLNSTPSIFGDNMFVVLQSASSEILPNNNPSRKTYGLSDAKAYVKKMCGVYETLGFKACTKIQSQNARSIRNTPFYTLIGKHDVFVVVDRGKYINNCIS